LPPPAETFHQGLEDLERLRQDIYLLQAFLTAEARLLVDLGVSQAAAARIRVALNDLLKTASETSELPTEREITDRLDQLTRQLESDLNHLKDDRRHRAIFKRLV
jgi:hypothetical protein